MSKVVVLMHLTLDGVMQAPGRPDEDPRGDFAHGGWAVSRGAAVSEAFGTLGKAGGLVFGRQTYEDFAAFWPNQTESPFSAILTNTQKYVASRTIKEPLTWSNSTLLQGDASEALGTLKQQAGHDLLIMGSGQLIQSLMRHNLIDEYILLIHPLILGAGRRLFPDGSPTTTLQLADTKMTESGVVMIRYRVAQSTRL